MKPDYSLVAAVENMKPDGNTTEGHRILGDLSTYLAACNLDEGNRLSPVESERNLRVVKRMEANLRFTLRLGRRPVTDL